MLFKQPTDINLNRLPIETSMNWFIAALIAATLFGVQSFLYKSISEKGCNKFLVTLIFILTVEILAIGAFLFAGLEFTSVLVTLSLGLLFGLFFFLKTIGQLKALDYLHTHQLFPITSSAIVINVLYGLFIFGESLRITQIIGIAIILAAIILIHRQSKKHADYKTRKIGFAFAFLALIFSAGVEITNKYASLYTNLTFFIPVAYLFLAGVSLLTHQITKKKHKQKAPFLTTLAIGVLIGIVNFFGYFLLLSALKTGPLSIVSPIQSLHVVIAVILARLIHKEELNPFQFALMLLSVAGIIMLRI